MIEYSIHIELFHIILFLIVLILCLQHTRNITKRFAEFFSRSVRIGTYITFYTEFPGCTVASTVNFARYDTF